MSKKPTSDRFEVAPARSASPPIREILDRAKAGDADAKEALWKLSEKYLLLIANQDLDSAMLQKFGASDVVQQSLIIANQKINTFDGNSKPEFLAWMRQILINECRQAVRGFRKTEKRNVRREHGLGIADQDSKQIQIDDNRLTPSTEAVRNEQLELVNEALAQLPKLDQEVIKMRNWQDLEFSEIGNAIGKSPEAARKIWSRAILKLENELRRIGAM